jgi:predicted AlkP superfamily phosphohydrolase/phosphomutase
LNRLLCIGLDAGDARLIDRWCDEGWLPNIARMKARGTSWPRLKTTADVFHVSAWPSIFTGTAADVHGLYHAYVARPGHQGVLRPRPDESPVPFFWKLLSDRGRRAVVIDAFLTCPLRDFNGVQMVDWGSWSWFWDPTILPASLKREIQNKFGPYPFEDHSRVGIVPVTDFAGFRERLLAAVSTKTKVVKWLIGREEWDLFLVVFGEAHPAGHYLWHLHDKSYVSHPRSGAAALEHALRDVYMALDTAVGELLENIDDRTTIILVSGDGIGPNYSGSHFLEDVLTRLGAFCKPGARTGFDGAATRDGDASADLASTIRAMVPQRVRIAISNTLLSRNAKERLSLRWKNAGIAWDRTRAFVIENANEGYVRVNLKGREPLGIVEPGAEYQALCDELCRTATTMTNPKTGIPAAVAVYKCDDICSGPCRSHMPDVVIIWNPEAKVTTELLLEKQGLVRSPAPSCGMPPFYTGNHVPNAFAIAVGPGVPASIVRRGASILDLAPTILTRLGIDPPAHMTGTVLNELVGRATPS